MTVVLATLAACVVAAGASASVAAAAASRARDGWPGDYSYVAIDTTPEGR